MGERPVRRVTDNDMTDDDPLFPGQRERPSGWTPTPTTPARSWAELLETIQGGLAVLDDEWHLRFVSDRFLSLLGQPNDLVGNDLRQLLPALTDDDPRGHQRQAERGVRVEFEQQFATSEGDRCWYRVTIVPCTGLGDGLRAVVFANDITQTSRALAQLREATVGLTEVESELHRRVGREVHDGPIQLLAALMFRLGISDADEAHELEQIVSEVAKRLRHVIADFSPASHRTEATQLEQWIAPFLVDSKMILNVDDRRSGEPGLAEVQAAFVLVYHVVRAAKDHEIDRTLNVVLTDEHGGQRIVLTIPSRESAVLAGSRAAQHRAITHHARALGGTLSVRLDDNGIRTVSMWIPKQTEPPKPPTARTLRSDQPPGVGSTNDVSILPQLGDSTWREIVTAAPERMLEFDDRMRVSFANAVQHETLGIAHDELIGLSVAQMFDADALSKLADSFDRLDAGEFVETDWYRESRLGDSRLIHLTMSPRLGETDQWQGLFVATDDRTDVEYLDGLYQTALADLTLARHRAIEASIRRLEQPLAECELLVERIEQFEKAALHPAPLHNITVELASTLSKIERSISVLGAPRPSISDLDIALRESLGTLLAGRRLMVVDNTETPPRPEVFDTLFRIAREAVNNAVLHGEASFISVTLSTDEHGFSCEIHDDGVGVDPEQLLPRPGHLGTRAMRERARERGGTCRIERDPRGGTLVRVRLPYLTDRPSILDSAAAP